MAVNPEIIKGIAEIFKKYDVPFDPGNATDADVSALGKKILQEIGKEKNRITESYTKHEELKDKDGKVQKDKDGKPIIIKVFPGIQEREKRDKEIQKSEEKLVAELKSVKDKLSQLKGTQLPEPSSHSPALRLLDLLEKYKKEEHFQKLEEKGVGKLEFDPYIWYSKEKFLSKVSELAHLITVMAEEEAKADVKKEEKADKTTYSPEVKAERIQELTAENLEDLELLKDLVEATIKDYAKRRDKLLKEGPSQKIKDFQQTHDLSWVDHPQTIVDAIGAIGRKLEKKEKPETYGHIPVDKTKFKAIENDTKGYKQDLVYLYDKLKAEEIPGPGVEKTKKYLPEMAPKSASRDKAQIALDKIKSKIKNRFMTTEGIHPDDEKKIDGALKEITLDRLSLSPLEAILPKKEKAKIKDLSVPEPKLVELHGYLDMLKEMHVFNTVHQELVGEDYSPEEETEAVNLLAEVKNKLKAGFEKLVEKFTPDMVKNLERAIDQITINNMNLDSVQEVLEKAEIENVKENVLKALELITTTYKGINTNLFKKHLMNVDALPNIKMDRSLLNFFEAENSDKKGTPEMRDAIKELEKALTDRKGKYDVTEAHKYLNSLKESDIFVKVMENLRGKGKIKPRVSPADLLKQITDLVRKKKSFLTVAAAKTFDQLRMEVNEKIIFNKESPAVLFKNFRDQLKKIPVSDDFTEETKNEAIALAEAGIEEFEARKREMDKHKTAKNSISFLADVILSTMLKYKICASMLQRAVHVKGIVHNEGHGLKRRQELFQKPVGKSAAVTEQDLISQRGTLQSHKNKLESNLGHFLGFPYTDPSIKGVSVRLKEELENFSQEANEYFQEYREFKKSVPEKKVALSECLAATAIGILKEADIKRRYLNKEVYPHEINPEAVYNKFTNKFKTELMGSPEIGQFLKNYPDQTIHKDQKMHDAVRSEILRMLNKIQKYFHAKLQDPSDKVWKMLEKKEIHDVADHFIAEAKKMMKMYFDNWPEYMFGEEPEEKEKEEKPVKMSPAMEAEINERIKDNILPHPSVDVQKKKKEAPTKKVPVDMDKRIDELYQTITQEKRDLKEDIDLPEGGGGGGAKSKGRPKEILKEEQPPAMTDAYWKDLIHKYMTAENALPLIDQILDDYAHSLKEKAEDGGNVSMRLMVESFKSALNNLLYHMKSTSYSDPMIGVKQRMKQPAEYKTYPQIKKQPDIQKGVGKVVSLLDNYIDLLYKIEKLLPGTIKDLPPHINNKEDLKKFLGKMKGNTMIPPSLLHITEDYVEPKPGTPGAPPTKSLEKQIEELESGFNKMLLNHAIKPTEEMAIKKLLKGLDNEKGSKSTEGQKNFLEYAEAQLRKYNHLLKEAKLYDKPTMMAFRVASRFIGVDSPKAVPEAFLE